MQVIGSAIERVDHPDMVGVALLAAFFGKNGVIWIMSFDGLDDRAFCGSIRIADEIVAALFLDAHFFDLVDVADERIPTATSGHDGHIEHCFHVMIPQLEKEQSPEPLNTCAVEVFSAVQATRGAGR